MKLLPPTIIIHHTPGICGQRDHTSEHHCYCPAAAKKQHHLYLASRACPRCAPLTPMHHELLIVHPCNHVESHTYFGTLVDQLEGTGPVAVLRAQVCSTCAAQSHIHVQLCLVGKEAVHGKSHR